jgi:predicted nucleotidyltransferase
MDTRHVSQRYRANIELDLDAIADLCERHRLESISLFGSVLRDTFKPESDVDVLFTLRPGVQIGYFALSGMEEELSRLIGRTADMRTPNGLSIYFRADVLAAAEQTYVRR